VLQWARASGCAWDKHTGWAARHCGHQAVLEWAQRNTTMGAAGACGCHSLAHVRRCCIVIIIAVLCNAKEVVSLCAL
jgi:hypothetical protein